MYPFPLLSCACEKSTSCFLFFALSTPTPPTNIKIFVWSRKKKVENLGSSRRSWSAIANNRRTWLLGRKNDKRLLALLTFSHFVPSSFSVHSPYITLFERNTTWNEINFFFSFCHFTNIFKGNGIFQFQKFAFMWCDFIAPWYLDSPGKALILGTLLTFVNVVREKFLVQSSHYWLEKLRDYF